jgi:8-oxo-dGTP pyrophosphatase MutT (NUDIX family)
MNDLRKFIGEAVSMLVLNGPLPVAQVKEAECLVIKRPSHDSWKPNYFSPVTGHVEERDIEYLKTFPEPWTNEKLYVETGKREFNEELKRSPSVFFLRHIGKYHDDETNYNVAVLSGEIYGAGTTIEKLVIPKIQPTKEAPEVHWMTVEQIQKIIEENKFAGKKSFEMFFEDLKKFNH